MSLFAVDWLPSSLNDLAAVWMLASNRQAVTTAQADVDRLLAKDPVGAGRHIREGLYRIHVPPLMLTYSIDEMQNLVEISKVWHAP